MLSQYPDVDVPAPLDAPILAAIEDYPAPPNFDKSPQGDKDDKASSGSKPRSNFFGKSEEGERKLPKWLKLGPSTYSRTVVLISLAL